MAVIVITALLRTTPDHAFGMGVDVDLHAGSMMNFGERVVGGVRRGCLTLGDEVTFAARHFGVLWRMTSRITVYERPWRCVDEQVRGPFGSWRHEHQYAWDDLRKVTVARDEISFEAPFGGVGWLVPKVLLERYMRRILTERNAYLASLCTD